MIASSSAATETPHLNTRARTLTIRVGDAHVQIEGLSAALRARLRDLTCPFVTRSASASAVHIEVGQAPSGRGWVVIYLGQALRKFDTSDDLLAYLEWFALTQAVGAMPGAVALHGAALSNGESCMLLLGASGAGKTTLTLGLMARGWRPLTDDIVLIDPNTLAIAPFPRCFHVDEAAKSLVAQQANLEWPGKLSGYARPTTWATGGQSATTLVVVQRCPTCMAARFPILQAEAAGGLLAEAAGTQLSASVVASVAARLAAGAKCYRLKNGPLESSLNLIEKACKR